MEINLSSKFRSTCTNEYKTMVDIVKVPEFHSDPAIFLEADDNDTNEIELASKPVSSLLRPEKRNSSKTVDNEKFEFMRSTAFRMFAAAERVKISMKTCEIVSEASSGSERVLTVKSLVPSTMIWILPALREIRSLILTDSWKRFKESNLFDEFLAVYMVDDVFQSTCNQFFESDEVSERRRNSPRMQPSFTTSSAEKFEDSHSR